MSLPSGLVLQCRIDDFSYQVYTSSDQRFWFRLERQRDRDVITDFYLGSFPTNQGGVLLVECYKTVGLAPQATLVFKDIIPRDNPLPSAVVARRELYTRAGTFLLNEFGIGRVDAHTDEAREKINLVLRGFPH